MTINTHIIKIDKIIDEQNHWKMMKSNNLSTASSSLGQSGRTPSPSKQKNVLATGGMWSAGAAASIHENELSEGEERSMIEPRCLEDTKIQELIKILIDWINKELCKDRIIVKNLEEDLFDGQILQKLLEKLTGQLLDVPEVTYSEEQQRSKLKAVLEFADSILINREMESLRKWTVESIHTKNLVSILHLLIEMAIHFRAPIRIPENVIIKLVVVSKHKGNLVHSIAAEQLTAEYGYDELGQRRDKDAFDVLFNHSDTLQSSISTIKETLTTFVNKHLLKINGQYVKKVTDLEKQFSDGIYLCFLIGLLEGFFVPLYDIHLNPKSFEEKVENVTFAFDLMQDVGFPKPKLRPEDIVNMDMKSTLRVIYSIFMKHKGKG